jgi:translation initiation factor IF-1
LRQEGVITELLPGWLVKVKLATGEELTAHVAEDFRRVSVPVKPGDRVMVQRAERDPKRGKIVELVR